MAVVVRLRPAEGNPLYMDGQGGFTRMAPEQAHRFTSQKDAGPAMALIQLIRRERSLGGRVDAVRAPERPKGGGQNLRT